jgi:hypothetical protein
VVHKPAPIKYVTHHVKVPVVSGKPTTQVLGPVSSSGYGSGTPSYGSSTPSYGSSTGYESSSY